MRRVGRITTALAAVSVALAAGQAVSVAVPGAGVQPVTSVAQAEAVLTGAPTTAPDGTRAPAPTPAQQQKLQRELARYTRPPRGGYRAPTNRENWVVRKGGVVKVRARA